MNFRVNSLDTFRFISPMRGKAESCGSDAVAVMDDGSVVVSGRAIVEDTQAFSFASCKLYAKGKLAWRWQVQHTVILPRTFSLLAT